MWKAPIVPYSTSCCSKNNAFLIFESLFLQYIGTHNPLMTFCGTYCVQKIDNPDRQLFSIVQYLQIKVARNSFYPAPQRHFDLPRSRKIEGPLLAGWTVPGFFTKKGFHSNGAEHYKHNCYRINSNDPIVINLSIFVSGKNAIYFYIAQRYSLGTLFFFAGASPLGPSEENQLTFWHLNSQQRVTFLWLQVVCLS